MGPEISVANFENISYVVGYTVFHIFKVENGFRFKCTKNVSKCISVYRLNNTQRRRKLPQLKSIIITLKALMTGREVALNTKLF